MNENHIKMENNNLISPGTMLVLVHLCKNAIEIFREMLHIFEMNMIQHDRIIAQRYNMQNQRNRGHVRRPRNNRRRQ